MTALLLIAPLLLATALGAVWSPRPVHAALFLALALSLQSVLYVVLGADFIGMVQFMVYVGAVAVLMVFALLMTRRDDEPREREKPRVAWIVGILLSGGVGTGVVALAGQSSASNAEAPSFSLTELGLRMFGEAAPAVLVVGVLLTAVMIGAAIVARDPGKEENGGDAP